MRYHYHYLPTCVKHKLRISGLKTLESLQSRFELVLKTPKNSSKLLILNSCSLLKLLDANWVSKVYLKTNRTEQKTVAQIVSHRPGPMRGFQQKKDFFHLFSVLPHVFINFMRGLAFSFSDQ